MTQSTRPFISALLVLALALFPFSAIGQTGFSTANGGAVLSGVLVLDGSVPVTKTTGSSATLGSFNSGYVFNQNATAATAVTYTLPVAAAGKQYCAGNSYNGTAANTGAITFQTSATGQFIIFNGALGATGGYVISAGGAGDKGCMVGIDATHWEFYSQLGAWTLH